MSKKSKTETTDDPFDCTMCRGKCCRYFALEIDTPDDFNDFDSIRWYLFHEQNYVFVEDGKWFLCISASCRNLAEDSSCKIYDTRPLVCRKHDPSECEFDDNTKWSFEETFHTPEQLETYVKKKLGKKVYENQYKKYEKKRAKKLMKDK